MAWLAVDEDGTEVMFDKEPETRFMGEWCDGGKKYYALPKGSIKKLIGRELTWADEPVELADA